MARAAAFFDLDRTLLRRSSALALAGSFREHGVIGRGQLAKAAAWQLLFAARGASAETVRKAAEDGLMVLKGFRVDDLRNLVATAMEPVLKPLVYQEPLHLVARHRERGEPVYIVSATLQEIVEELARELGFDGAIGSTCEIVDGVYTGRSLRGAHGEGKAAAIRELAEEAGLDLAASTAYSDSHTDLPFLEAVGNPVVVNPDRELRRIAVERGWPMLEFDELAYPSVRAAASRADRASVRRRRGRRDVGCHAAVRPEERIAALGFSEADTATLSEHFLDAESRGKLGHGLSRIDWLETLGDLQPDAQPQRLHAEPGYERWDGNGALGYLTLAAIVDAQLADPPRARARRRRLELLPDRRARLVRAPARRGRSRRRADRDLTGPAAAPGGRRAARGHESAGDRDPELGRQAARHRRLDGRGHLRRRPARRRAARGARPVRRRAVAQGVRARARARSCSSTRSPARATARCSSSRGRRRIRSRRSASARPGCDSPATP